MSRTGLWTLFTAKLHYTHMITIEVYRNIRLYSALFYRCHSVATARASVSHQVSFQSRKRTVLMFINEAINCWYLNVERRTLDFANDNKLALQFSVFR